jgi:hypothetical protein
MLLGKLRAILRHKGFKVFTRPYELNIIGIRSANTVPNRFDDEFHVFYKTGPLNWNYHVFKGTTDPGTYWLRNPMQPQGTAILAEGQYVNAYQIGIHLGKYEALVQRKPVTVIRDYDRDALLDFKSENRTTGMYGINIHRASVKGTTKYVDKHSAGCQVFENIDDYLFFRKLCYRHRDLYGNSFTYTLIDYRAVLRQTVRGLAVGAGIASVLLLGVLAYVNRYRLKTVTDQISDSFKSIFKKTELNYDGTNNNNTRSTTSVNDPQMSVL